MAILVMFGGSLLIFWNLRDATHLLGDGGRTIMDAMPPQRAHLSEMMPGLLNALAIRWLAPLEINSRAILESLNCLWGALFLLAAIHFARQIANSFPQRLLFSGLLLTSGAIQFGFGYVESYPLLHVLTLCYLGLGCVALKAESIESGSRVPRSFLLNSLFVLAIAAHLSALSLAPAHGYLLTRMAKKTGWRPIVIQFLGSISAIALFLIAASAGFGIKIERLTLNSAILPWNGQYSLFSSAHILDFLNEVALVMPASLPVALSNPKQLSKALMRAKDARSTFLLVAAASTAGLAFAIDPILGMARDWDLVSLFWLPSTLLLTTILLRTGSISARSSIAIVATALLCTAPWIAVNHDVDAATARFLHLLRMDRDRPGTAYGYEILGTQLRYRGRYQDAADAFESALELRASSKRLQGQLAHAKLLLAREHVRNHRLPEALSVLGTLESDDRSVRAEMHFLSGIAWLEQDQCTPAVDELEKAIALGWTSENVLFHLGFAFRECGRHDRASQMFRDYLSQYPAGPYSNPARRFLKDEEAPEVDRTDGPR